MQQNSTNTIQIDCPQHPGSHTATLYKWPHRFGGVWECPTTGVSDVHEHVNLKTEVTEEKDVIYVCELDEVAVDLNDMEFPQLSAKSLMECLHEI